MTPTTTITITPVVRTAPMPRSPTLTTARAPTRTTLSLKCNCTRSPTAKARNGSATMYERALSYDYHPNSGRLQRMRTSNPAGGYRQDLAYTYDRVSNVKSITDNVSISGPASGSITNVFYDDLHRLTQMTSVAWGTSTY